MIIPAGFYQANIVFVGAGVPTGAAITFGGENPGPLTAEQVADEISTSWDTSGMVGMYDQEVSTDRIQVKLGPNATGAFFDLQATYQGDMTGETGAPQVATLVSKQTQLGGRFFIPGLTESFVLIGGLIDGTELAAMQTIVDAFLTALVTNGVPMYLLHNDSTAPTEVDSLEVQSRVGTQRKRNRR